MEKQLPPGASLDKVKLEGFLSHWKKAVSSASAYLNNLFIPWFSLTESCNGPTHWGWSRLISENFKSKKYYNLLMTRPPDASRNPNEQKWRDSGLPTFTSERFDKLYRNISKLKCNLRVKYEDFRILWGRQELNHYKSLYSSLPGRKYLKSKQPEGPYKAVREVPSLTQSNAVPNTYLFRWGQR